MPFYFDLWNQTCIYLVYFIQIILYCIVIDLGNGLLSRTAQMYYYKFILCIELFRFIGLMNG